MWRPTLEFVFGLTLGFIYAYLNAFFLSDTFAFRRPLRSNCYQSREPARDTLTTKYSKRNEHAEGSVHTLLTDDMGTSLSNRTRPNNESQKRDYRIFCWIMTSPQNLEKRAKYVQRTWAKRCDQHIFISSETNKTFPTFGVDTSEGRDHLTEKTMLGFEYVYKYHYNNGDWFLKADDDAYVIVENLRYFLSNQDTEEPIYFGHHFKTIVDQGYFSGGSGFVVSKEALRRFGELGTEYNLCRNQHGVAGDANFGKCMQNLGVKVGNSTDKYGRNRFHCFDPETHLRGNYPSWYYSYDANGARYGTKSMSEYAISFHYMEDKLLTVHHLLYHVRPYGLSNEVTEYINQKLA